MEFDVTYQELINAQAAKQDFQISKNIAFSEAMISVAHDGLDIFTYPIDEQMGSTLLYVANDIIQPVRDCFGSCHFSSAVRSSKSYARLIAQGYHPAPTSDHYFRQNINGYTSAAGAFDTIPRLITPEEMFKQMLSGADRATGDITLPNGVKIRVGQMLLEYTSSDNSAQPWVHISGDRTQFDPGRPYAFHFAESHGGVKFVQV